MAPSSARPQTLSSVSPINAASNQYANCNMFAPVIPGNQNTKFYNYAIASPYEVSFVQNKLGWYQDPLLGWVCSSTTGVESDLASIAGEQLNHFSSWTWSSWVYPTDDTNNILCYMSNGNNSQYTGWSGSFFAGLQLTIGLYSSTFRAQYRNGTSGQNVSVSYSTAGYMNAWSHYAVRMDRGAGKTIKIYLNGSEVASTSHSAITFASHGASYHHWNRDGYSDTARNFDGYWAGMTYHNAALDPSIIAEMATAGLEWDLYGEPGTVGFRNRVSAGGLRRPQRVMGRVP